MIKRPLLPRSLLIGSSGCTSEQLNEDTAIPHLDHHPESRIRSDSAYGKKVSAAEENHCDM